MTPRVLRSRAFFIISSSFETIAPPSPDVIFFIPSKLKQEISPKLPIFFYQGMNRMHEQHPQLLLIYFFLAKE